MRYQVFSQVRSSAIKYTLAYEMSNQVSSKFLATMSMEHAVGTLTNSQVSKTRESFHNSPRGFLRIPLEYLRHAQSTITYNRSTKAKQFPLNPSLKHAQFLVKLREKLSSLNH